MSCDSAGDCASTEFRPSSQPARRFFKSAALLLAATGVLASPVVNAQPTTENMLLAKAAAEAEQQLKQTFTNLQFEDFGPAPVKGKIYQATAGGKIVYYAPESEHLLFATIFDKNGVNLTALAQEAGISNRLKSIDSSQALEIGPKDAPTVIEFTDPDCPYCRALDRYWAAKAAEGLQVRRLVFFVSGIHPEAAAKAEHILCSADKAAAFKSIYAGAAPAALRTCTEGRARVEAHAKVVGAAGVSGTPTLIAGGKLISGFQQAEIETFVGIHSFAVDMVARPLETTARFRVPRCRRTTWVSANIRFRMKAATNISGPAGSTSPGTSASATTAG